MLVSKAISYSLVALPILLSSATQLRRQGPDNPYWDRAQFVNGEYARKLEMTVAYFNNTYDFWNAGRTRTVQKVPVFTWLDNTADVASIKWLVQDALKVQHDTYTQQLVQLVVYNLPDRDCSARASDGELHGYDGLYYYMQFIDEIVSHLTTPEAQQLHFVVIIEPDALGDILTGQAYEDCVNAVEIHREALRYAISRLQLPYVSLYLDAGHGGWLGSADVLDSAAKLFAEVLRSAQETTPGGAWVRGLAINVSNYNQYKATVRESYTQNTPSWDEFHYVNSLVPYLQNVGFPTHFIVDQGRSGKGGIRSQWEAWCNLKNAGFGIRPTCDQAIIQNEFVDAIVWVKPGGESDGTTDPNSERFDSNCVSSDALVPAPESGDWFNEYAANLVKNADPPLESTP